MCFSFSNDDELSFRWHWSSSATSMLIIVCTCISALWWFLLNCFGLSKNHLMRINQPLHIRSMWVNDPRSVLKSAIQHHEQSNIVSKQIALMSLCYTAVYNIVIVIAINNWRTSAHSIDIRNVHWFPSIRRCRRRKKPWQLTTVKNHWCWYAQPLAFRSVRLQFVTHYSKRRQRRNGKKNPITHYVQQEWNMHAYQQISMYFIRVSLRCLALWHPRIRNPKKSTGQWYELNGESSL